MPDSKAPLILSLETATRTGSVALQRGPQLLALQAGDEQTSHSTKILGRVREALDEARILLEEVELFAAASGPGSFTGLRIGLATVKSFAATLKRPCIGIPTLGAIAHAAGPSERTLAMLPAGRGEVFAQLFSVDAKGFVLALDEAVHQPPEKLVERAMDFCNLKLAGEGARQHAALLTARLERERIYLRDEETGLEEDSKGAEKTWIMAAPQSALARSVAALAYQGYRRGEAIEAEGLRAIYVRASDAELKTQEQ